MDEHEQRTYIIVQEAVKEAITPINRTIYGNGDSGLKGDVNIHTHKIKFNRKLIYALYGLMGTVIAGSLIALFTYIITSI